MLSSQVTLTVGIASRATQRAFACDLNGKHRGIALEDAAPSSHQLTDGESRSRLFGHGSWMQLAALRDQHLAFLFSRCNPENRLFWSLRKLEINPDVKTQIQIALYV